MLSAAINRVAVKPVHSAARHTVAVAPAARGSRVVVRANPDPVKTAQDLIAQGAAALKNIDADKVGALLLCFRQCDVNLRVSLGWCVTLLLWLIMHASATDTRPVSTSSILKQVHDSRYINDAVHTLYLWVAEHACQHTLLLCCC
jgi:hypothetical protein